MAYHFKGTHLRVMQKFSRQTRNIEALKNTRGIFVLHALPTSVEFIRNLKEAGVEISHVLIKPYSIEHDSRDFLEELSNDISVLDYNKYDEQGTAAVTRILERMLENSKSDARQIFGFDIGGYLLEPFADAMKQSAEAKNLIVGIIEDTTFGHNKYVDRAKEFSVPIFSVARSQLKEIEARFVGRDAVVACDMVLRKQGIMLSGRKALSIGYGMIGTNVAQSLRANDLIVSVYDKQDSRNLHAYMDGFDVNKKAVLLKNADIIFSQTASKALSFEEIEECKDGVVLASVGSRNTEFAIAELKSQANGTENYGNHIVEYTLSNSKRVRVIHDGAAVNFLNPSLPTEIFDLVFSEAFLALMLLLKRNKNYPAGSVHEIPENFLNNVSRDWLRSVNS